MRFEIIAAYAMGITLPMLEAARRRTDFDNIPSYIDDFIIGGLLLYAARAAMLERRNGNILLVAAWAVLCGGFYYSFFGQLQSTDARDVSGVSNDIVILIKGILYLVSITCLVLSIRSAASSVKSPNDL